jgi:hypothetical protein
MDYRSYDQAPDDAADEPRLNGLNADMTCNLADPKNARYLQPLETPADEKRAHMGADEVFRLLPEYQVYEQCLVDARRMLLDPRYRELLAKWS